MKSFHHLFTKPWLYLTIANKIVAEFLDKISSIEPKFVEGLYLTGSLPMNDFYFNKSDIDFVVLCNRLPDQENVTQFKHIHKTIAKRYSKPDLSGTYLAIDSLHTSNPEKIKKSHLSRRNTAIWNF